MFEQLKKAIFGTETKKVTNTVTSYEPGTTEGATEHHTPEEVESMTTAQAVEAVRAQHDENRAKVLERCTEAKKTAREVEKVEKKTREAEAESITAQAMPGTSDKEKQCKKAKADLLRAFAEELRTMHAEQVTAEAHEAARVQGLREKAGDILKKIESHETTAAQVEKDMTTEEVEILRTVAAEVKKSRRDQAKKATDQATSATKTHRETDKVVLLRHMTEGTATAEESSRAALYDVEDDKSDIWATVSGEVAEMFKKVGNKLKNLSGKVFTVSETLKRYQENPEEWNDLFKAAAVEIDVKTVTPADIFGRAHVFMLAPTAEGLKAGTGKSARPVTRWNVETLFSFIVTNDILCKKVTDPVIVEGHRARLEQAAHALKEVARLEEEKKKATERAEAVTDLEKHPDPVTVEEVEQVTGEVRAIESQLKAAQETAREAVTEVREEKAQTGREVEKARRRSRKASQETPRRANRSRKAAQEAAQETPTASQETTPEGSQETSVAA